MRSFNATYDIFQYVAAAALPVIHRYAIRVGAVKMAHLTLGIEFQNVICYLVDLPDVICAWILTAARV